MGSAERRSRTKNIDDTFVARLEQDENILHEHPKSSYVEFIFQIIQIKLGGS